LNFDGDYEKELTRRTARKVVQKIMPDRYFFVAEAWMSKNKDTRPSEADDKQEIVHIVEYNRDMTQKICMVPIERNKDKIKLGKPIIDSKDKTIEIKDRWNFYLEED